MPNLQRSPPLNKSQSMSDSDVAKLSAFNDEFKVTQRDKKRRRISDEEIENKQTYLRTIIREELKDILESLQMQQNLRLDTIEKHISEIKIQNESNHKKHLEIEKSIGYVSDKLEEIQSIIYRLEKDRNKLATQISKIEDKCDYIERNSRKTSLQIRNVLRLKGETKQFLFDMVQKLSSALDILA
jgi:chromosome segregation ATPase